MRWTKTILMISVVAMSLLGVAAAEESQIARFVGEGVPPIPWALPDGVSLAAEPVAEGRDALRIDYTGEGAVSVPLFQVDEPGVDDCTLIYRARIKGENLAALAYPEILCGLGQGESFGRGLLDGIEGTADWREAETKFFLRPGETPGHVRLGVRFEGPGTVWVEDPRLIKALPSAFANTHGAIWGMIGGLGGTLLGLWGAMAGTLAPRGKSRGFVLASGALLLVLCLGLLAVGVAKIFAGAAWQEWYPWVLSGGIGTVVLTPLLPVVYARYLQAETRRMEAADLTGDDGSADGTR